MREDNDQDPVEDLVRSLHDGLPPMSEHAFDEGRSRLRAVLERPADPAPVTASAPRSPRPANRWLPLATAAAAIVAVSAGVVIFVNTPEQTGVAGGGSTTYQPTPEHEPKAPDGSLPTELPPAAEEPVNPAGVVVPEVTDPAQQNGQFLYVSRHTWYRTGGGAGPTNKTGPGEAVSEEWVPADRTQDWRLVLDRDVDQPGEPYTDDSQRPASQVEGDSQDEGAFVAPRGRYLVSADTPGSFKHPAPEFLASLPRDPRALYESLRSEAKGTQDAQGTLFTKVVSLLQGGTVPADLRAALYGALGYHPWVVVEEHAKTRDDRRAVSIWAEDRVSSTKTELLVDPLNGQLIGTRTTQRQPEQANPSVSPDIRKVLPDGTVLSETTLEYDVVDDIGDRPGR